VAPVPRRSSLVSLSWYGVCDWAWRIIFVVRITAYDTLDPILAAPLGRVADGAGVVWEVT
jgi:hypothetical protein